MVLMTLFKQKLKKSLTGFHLKFIQMRVYVKDNK